jgi:hypothetical protein
MRFLELRLVIEETGVDLFDTRLVLMRFSVFLEVRGRSRTIIL